MHPELKLDWNLSEENGVYPYYRATQGWKDGKIKRNVIDRLDPKLYDFSEFDKDSIMAYVVKAERSLPILKDKKTGEEIEIVGKTNAEVKAETERIIKAGGELEIGERIYKILNTPFEIKDNTVLSVGDKIAAAEMYPGRFGPTTESGNGWKLHTFTHSEKGDRSQFAVGDMRDWSKHYDLPKGRLIDVIVEPSVSGSGGASLTRVFVDEDDNWISLAGLVEDGTFVYGEIDVEIRVYYYPPQIIAESLEPITD